MDISDFLLSLLNSLSDLKFAEKVDFNTEVFILKAVYGSEASGMSRCISMSLRVRLPLRSLRESRESGGSILIICGAGTCIHLGKLIPTQVSATRALKKL